MLPQPQSHSSASWDTWLPTPDPKVKLCAWRGSFKVYYLFQPILLRISSPRVVFGISNSPDYVSTTSQQLLASVLDPCQFLQFNADWFYYDPNLAQSPCYQPLVDF